MIGVGGKLNSKFGEDLNFEFSVVGEFGQASESPFMPTVGNWNSFAIPGSGDSIKELKIRRKGAASFAFGGLVKYCEYEFVVGYGNYGSTGGYDSASFVAQNGSGDQKYDKSIKNWVEPSKASGHYLSLGTAYTGKSNGISLTYFYGNVNGSLQ